MGGVRSTGTAINATLKPSLHSWGPLTGTAKYTTLKPFVAQEGLGRGLCLDPTFNNPSKPVSRRRRAVSRGAAPPGRAPRRGGGW